MATSEIYEVLDLDSASSGPDSDDTRDYTQSVLDLASDQDSDFSCMEDEEVHASPQRRSNHTLHKQRSARQRRRIISSTPPFGAPETGTSDKPPPFAFLSKKFYSCSCHLLSPVTQVCSVLGYFQLAFVRPWDPHPSLKRMLRAPAGNFLKR
jgi:hypothetical protein